MQLEFESGKKINAPTEKHLEAIEGEEFAILSKDDGTYMQCAEIPEPPYEYVLEYQEGTLDQHFEAIDGPITLTRVVEAFRKYMNGDESWRTDFEWNKMDLS